LAEFIRPTAIIAIGDKEITAFGLPQIMGNIACL